MVGLRGDDKIMFGECKWSKNKVGRGVLYDLKEKAKKVKWGGEDREERYVLFSKSGFEGGLEEIDDVRLYDFEDLESMF